MCVITFDWENTDAKIKFEHFNLNPSVSWAVIELTNYCNFKCKWCYANSGINGLHMNRNDVEKLIRNLATYGIKQITFSGGEPLFYAHINEAIKYAKSFDLVIHMNTNGYLFTKELAFELKDAGLSQIQTNVDSLDPKKHDYIRGKEGSFQRAIEALKNARDSGLICVMQTVLTRLNETEIFDIFKFISNTNIPEFQYGSELFMLIFVFLYYRLLNININFAEKSIQETLKLFVYLLGVLYLFVILARILLNPSFEPGGFPNLPETFSSVIVMWKGSRHRLP